MPGLSERRASTLTRMSAPVSPRQRREPACQVGPVVQVEADAALAPDDQVEVPVGEPAGQLLLAVEAPVGTVPADDDAGLHDGDRDPLVGIGAR